MNAVCLYLTEIPQVVIETLLAHGIYVSRERRDYPEDPCGDIERGGGRIHNHEGFPHREGFEPPAGASTYMVLHLQNPMGGYVYRVVQGSLTILHGHLSEGEVSKLPTELPRLTLRNAVDAIAAMDLVIQLHGASAEFMQEYHARAGAIGQSMMAELGISEEQLDQYDHSAPLPPMAERKLKDFLGWQRGLRADRREREQANAK